MNKENWTLLVISAANDEGLTPLKLQKSLFLLSKNIPKIVGSRFYNFTPYNYGPFDKEIYRDVETLQIEGFIRISYPPRQWWREYYITPKGKKEAKEKEKNLDKKAMEYVGKLVKWINELSFQEIISYVYNLYPEYKVNSALTR